MSAGVAARCVLRRHSGAQGAEVGRVHEGTGGTGLSTLLRRPVRALLCVLVGLGVLAVRPAIADTVLFIGNSFTYGQGSPVRFYRGDTVTDLNGGGIGGVPALFKAFADQAGLAYEVYLETEPGVGLEWHLQNRSAVLASRPWNTVVMQGYSTLDARRPGDAGVLISSARRMAELLRQRNPDVRLWLEATWPRADQVYEPAGAWHGQSVQAMARDLRAGYEQAAAAIPGAHTGVAGVGQAWITAMAAAVADDNPYDGIAPGTMDLWTFDHYHASTYGYYLSALVLFGSITGRDPRALGPGECSGFELGLSGSQVRSLQQAAFEQLAADAVVPASAPAPADAPARPARCKAR